MITKCPHCHAAIPDTGETITESSVCFACGGSLVTTTDEVATASSTKDDAATASVTTDEVSANTRLQNSVLGDYSILEQIAGGGMGVVYRARQRQLNRIVALKTIRSGEFAEEEEIRRFQLEAEAAAQLDHPNIVPVFEVGESDGIHFLAMGLVDGHSLSDDVRHSPLDPQRATQLVCTLARAVQFAHEKGIIHRDIKPSNVLIDESGEPRITDFGLAKQIDAADDLTTSGQILGTPGYMAPEQARGDIGVIGPGTDVYGLGALFYCLLTARAPFQAANPLETIRQVVDCDPVAPRELNPAIDRNLEVICLKYLEKDSSRRYVSAGHLADDLNRYLNDEPIVARPASFAERARKFSKRNRVLVRGILTTFCALVLGLIGTATGLKAALDAAEFARGQTQRAVKAEGEARSEASRAREASRRLAIEVTQSHARVAELAMQRGDWDSALEFLRKAIEGNHPASAKLAIQLADVHFHRLELTLSQQALRPVLDAGPSSAEFGAALFRQGLIRLHRARTVDEGDAALNTIQASLDHPLGPADEAYVRAILCDDLSAGLEHLETALQHAPFDLKAWQLKLLYTSLCKGLPAGASIARTAGRMFPSDAMMLMYDIVVSAAHGQSERARELLEMHGHIVSAHLREFLELYVGMFDDMSAFSKSDHSPEQRGVYMLVVLAPTLMRMQAVFAEQDASGEFSFGPFYASPFRPFVKIVPRMLNAILTQDDAAMEAITRDLSRMSPTALLMALHAQMTASHSDEIEDATDRLKKLEDALLIANRATTAPPLFFPGEEVVAKTIRLTIIERIKIMASSTADPATVHPEMTLRARQDIPEILHWQLSGKTGELMNDVLVDPGSLLQIAVSAVHCDAPGYALEAIQEYVRLDNSKPFDAEVVAALAFLKADAPLAALRHLRNAAELDPEEENVPLLLDRARSEARLQFEELMQ